MSFLTKKLNPNKMPKHIAFIIDGNGRWAKKRGMSRSFGHEAGIKSLKSSVNACFDLGINTVSIYGFSTENWNRPKEELDNLFELFRQFIATDFFAELQDNVKLQIMGDYTKFPDDLVKEISDAVLKSEKNKTNNTLNLGLNYGGRHEILRAVNTIIKENKTEVSEEEFGKYLYTYNLPDPDFIIRTSGELRLSNFMSWQSAYSELYFPKILWPDFNKKTLVKCLLQYQKRNRRFGAIKENK